MEARYDRPGWTAKIATCAQFSVLVALLVLAVVHGASMMNYNWQWYRVPGLLVREIEGTFYLGRLIEGMLVTIDVSWKALLLALLFGLATAILRLSNSFVGRAIARVYLEVIRNTPLLVQLYVFYFVLAPVFGLERYLVGILALALFEGAYISEIIRAGILAVARGQWEAAQALGLSKTQVYRFVVLPQALRIVLPPIASQAIALVKASAMLSVIAVFDLTNEGRDIIAETFMTFEVWLTVAGLYFALTLLLTGGVTALEKALSAPK